MRLLQSKRRSAIAPAIGTLSNKSIIKLTLPIGSEGGVTLGIRIGCAAGFFKSRACFIFPF